MSAADRPADRAWSADRVWLRFQRRPNLLKPGALGPGAARRLFRPYGRRQTSGETRALGS